jgi:hypothetical protein
MNTKFYVISKIDNKQYCRKNGQFTRHLRTHGLTYKDYYETYITGVTPVCACTKPLTFYQKDESYAKSCGSPKCVGKNVSVTKQSWTEEQVLQDLINKKKAAYSRTKEEVAEQVAKSKATQIAKYGMLATQTEEFKAEASATKLKKIRS